MAVLSQYMLQKGARTEPPALRTEFDGNKIR